MSNITSASGEASVSSGGNIGDDNGTQQQQLRHLTAPENCIASNSTHQFPVKRKRNLPGTPDPDAEVIALSPKTLMATNRFICEICNKGFQRDQNLQLHRRGHNLPWKLRQRTSTEIRKRVYICPEPSCVHHDPSRALGDLTGIKKHFCRKHGEKKWKCDKCSKRYAVQSDWKAHTKTCGTREYRCDCGTLFSRRDSFITHRAFCDALAEDSTRDPEGIPHSQMSSISPRKSNITNSPAIGLNDRNLSSRLGESRLSSANWEESNSRLTRPGPLSLLLRPRHHDQGAEDEIMQVAGNNKNGHTILQNQSNPTEISAALIFNHGVVQSTKSSNMAQSLLGLSDPDTESQLAAPKPNLSEVFPMAMTTSNSGSMYSNMFNTDGEAAPQFHGMMNGISGAMDHIHQLMNNGITTSSGSGNRNLITSADHHGRTSSAQQHNMTMSSPCSNRGAQMSATALLQKAAQMGATASNSSMLNINPRFAMAGSDTSSGPAAVGPRSCWQHPAGAYDQRPESGSFVSHHNLDNNSVNHPFNIKPYNMEKNPAPSAMNLPPGYFYFPAPGTGRSSDNIGALQDLMNSLPDHEAPGADLYLENGMQERYGHGNDNILDQSRSSTLINGGPYANQTDIIISTRHRRHHVPDPVTDICINDTLQRTDNISNPLSLQCMEGTKHQVPARPAHCTADQDGGDNFTRDFLGVGVQAGCNNLVLNAPGDDHAGGIRRSILSEPIRDRDHPVNSRSQPSMVGSALMDLDSHNNNA